MNIKVLLPDRRLVGTGWRPPVPDIRDYAADHPKLKDMMRKLGMRLDALLPPKVDLRQWCSPIETQGTLGSCTAHAAAGILEYFECRSFSHSVTASRLFIYKNARICSVLPVMWDLIYAILWEHWPCAACLRKNIGLIRIRNRILMQDPSAFVYAVADNYEALKYFCHDAVSAKLEPDAVLRSVKRFLAAGVPSMFGFFGFDSFADSDIPGGIPYPGPAEQSQWGHAVMAAGYDDTDPNQEYKVRKCFYRGDFDPKLLGHFLGRSGVWLDSL